MSKSPCSAAMLSLVQCVEEYPLIWDKDNVFYKNSRKTNVAWCDIAEKLQMNKECCRVRWARLRNSFLRMVTPDGRVNYNRMRFNATIYKQMHFLLPFINHKNAGDDTKENVNKENVNKENVNKENVNEKNVKKSNDLKKISKLLKESNEENEKIIAKTKAIEEQFCGPNITNNFDCSQVFSHWPSILCTPALQLNWITPLETIVASSSSTQQNNNSDNLAYAIKNLYAPKMNNIEIKGLEQTTIPNKNEQRKEKLYKESDIQEANSYFR